jgi:hypothetical protein
MFVCCVLSGRGLCDELITRPEESYRLWRIVCVIKKPRERGGHSPRWAGEPDKQTNNVRNIEVRNKKRIKLRPFSHKTIRVMAKSLRKNKRSERETNFPHSRQCE